MIFYSLEKLHSRRFHAVGDVDKKKGEKKTKKIRKREKERKREKKAERGRKALQTFCDSRRRKKEERERERERERESELVSKKTHKTLLCLSFLQLQRLFFFL